MSRHERSRLRRSHRGAERLACRDSARHRSLVS